METTSLILHDHTNMQDVKDDEETDPAATQLSSSVKQVRSDPAATQLSTSVKQVRSDPAATQLSSSVKQVRSDPAATQLSSLVKQVRSDLAAKLLPTSMKQLSLSQLKQREAQWVSYELSDSSLYSGLGFVYNELFTRSSWDVDRTLSELNFKYIDLDKHIRRVDLKTCLSTIAQSIAYPKTPSAAGSQPFVIAVFVTGWRGQFPGSLQTLRGSVDIVDDIIKPFLPKSAPHLAHIPKLFFINSWVDHKDLDTQPPSFPDDKDANYCIAYHLGRETITVDVQEWMRTIARGLRSNMTVQDVIEDSRSYLDKHNERLYTFSCLKDKLILGK